MQNIQSNQTIPSLLTVKQFSEKYPNFKESSLRWLNFNKDDNGFRPAFKKVGGRVFVDEYLFFKCIEDNQ